MRGIAAADRVAGDDATRPHHGGATRGYAELNDSKRRTRRTVVIAAAAIATVLVLGVAFFLGKVPDIPAMVREPFAVAMLEHRTDRNSFERFLTLSGAAWHEGYGYQRDAAFSAFDAASRARARLNPLLLYRQHLQDGSGYALSEAMLSQPDLTRGDSSGLES